jgi:hypothetical protein
LPQHETLLDPDDVAAEHVVRIRRASPDRIVRSRQRARPPVVSVDQFTQAQLRRRSRSAGGMRGMAEAEWTRTRGTRPHVLRGLVRVRPVAAPPLIGGLNQAAGRGYMSSL